jgi:hypothetical protein
MLLRPRVPVLHMKNRQSIGASKSVRVRSAWCWGFLASALLGGMAQADHGRDFLAQYEFANVMKPDAEHVQLSLHVLLTNHTGNPISQARITLTASLADSRPLGTFPSPVTLGVRAHALLTATFTVPAATYQQWQRGSIPALWVDLPGRRAIHNVAPSI